MGNRGLFHPSQWSHGLLTCNWFSSGPRVRPGLGDVGLEGPVTSNLRGGLGAEGKRTFDTKKVEVKLPPCYQKKWAPKTQLLRRVTKKIIEPQANSAIRSCIGVPCHSIYNDRFRAHLDPILRIL